MFEPDHAAFAISSRFLVKVAPPTSVLGCVEELMDVNGVAVSTDDSRV